MIKQEGVTSLETPPITYREQGLSTIDDFLKYTGDLNKNARNYSISIYRESLNRRKINPFLKIATVNDAQELTEICKDAYAGTYPYKEMEDVLHIKKLIESDNNHFILFKDAFGTTLGCFKCMLNFKIKKGYMGGFMIKREYHSKIDIIKAITGSYIWMWNTFKDKILIWFCENRTAHSTSQYITKVCGINTIALLPNKDIFFNKVESDVFGIIYVEKALKELRCTKTPNVVKEVVDYYLFSDKLYDLGIFEIKNPSLILNKTKIAKLENEMSIKIEKKRFGYEIVKFNIKSSDSFFSFQYSPKLQNIEKTEYRVKNMEELFSFLQEFRYFIEKKKIRYCEVFVSAYKPTHQKLFLKMGLRPRGYIPSWKYKSKKNHFKDFILFNYYTGYLNNINLLPEVQPLLHLLTLEKTVKK